MDRLEGARERLEKAVARLEDSLKDSPKNSLGNKTGGDEAGGRVTAISSGDEAFLAKERHRLEQALADARAENRRLAERVRTVSGRLDLAIGRLKSVLDA